MLKCRWGRVRKDQSPMNLWYTCCLYAGIARKLSSIRHDSIYSITMNAPCYSSKGIFIHSSNIINKRHPVSVAQLSTTNAPCNSKMVCGTADQALKEYFLICLRAGSNHVPADAVKRDPPVLRILTRQKARQSVVVIIQV